jgi:ubiquinone/menaquinone biosynthesis C-methylase UbiE
MNDLYDHKAANEQKWSQRAATYDDKRFDYFRFMQRELIASAKITSPSNFLDLGCGTGWAVYYVAKLLDGKGKFIGVDISKVAVLGLHHLQPW